MKQKLKTSIRFEEILGFLWKAQCAPVLDRVNEIKKFTLGKMPQFNPILLLLILMARASEQRFQNKNKRE